MARAIARVGDLLVIVDPNPHQQVVAHAEWSAWGTQVASEPEVAFRECDAVWIATPTSEHARIVRDALDHDCHVLCEKPVVTTLAEADALAWEARDRGLAFMAGHLSLYTGTHDAAKWACASGAKGEISAVRRNPAPSLSDGSVLWGLGPHDVAAIYDLRGMPTRVSCEGTHHRVEAVLEYENHDPAVLELDWIAEHRERRFEIGDKDFATAQNEMEPLLREAMTFVSLCQSEQGREEKRVEIRSVTWMLAQLEDERCRKSHS